MSSLLLFVSATAPSRGIDWAPNPYSSDFDWFPPIAHYDTNLYIEPIEGLTQARHIAPSEFAVPLGTTVRFRQACDPAARVRWEGADLVDGERTASIAERTMSFVGTFLVRANITKGSEHVSNVCRVRVVNVALSAVRVVSVQPVVSPVLVHEELSNAMTMGYFFGESIAPVRSIRAIPRRGGAKANPSGDVEIIDRFRTSINRSILFEIATIPPGFDPLMEIRPYGHPSVTRSDGPIKFENAGVYRIAVGPLHNEKELKIETYRVNILGHDQGDGLIPEGVPVTFQAVTDPPGYEDEIIWLTSTKYGTASPVWGQGPTFTARFDNTFGLEDGFQWLGVRADNSVINQDQKIRPLCQLFDDPFLTPTSPGSSITFGSPDIPQIPAGFFGTASGFAGTIDLNGVHLAPPGSQFFTHSGMTDTVVTRSGKVECPAGVGMPCNPVDIEIKDISVTAPAPIVVNGVEWLPAMGLSATSQGTGTLQADLLCANGGTYSASLPVLPMFAFARKSHVAELNAGTRLPENVEVRILDFGSEPAFDPVMMDLGTDVAWSRTCTPDGGFCGNDPPVAADTPPFYPGHDGCALFTPTDEATATGEPEIVCAGGGCHGVEAEHAHCVCRVQPPPMGRCAYTRLGTIEVTPPPECGKCTAPATSKLALTCKTADADACDPGHPCPPFVIAIFRCVPAGKCIAFYACTGCMG